MKKFQGETIPVMSTENNPLAAQLSRKLSNVVAHTLVAIVFQRVRWCILLICLSMHAIVGFYSEEMRSAPFFHSPCNPEPRRGGPFAKTLGSGTAIPLKCRGSHGSGLGSSTAPPMRETLLGTHQKECSLGRAIRLPKKVPYQKGQERSVRSEMGLSRDCGNL